MIAAERKGTHDYYNEIDAGGLSSLVDTPEGRRFEPVAVKSIQWEFPVVEYHPFREYGTRYAFAAIVQIGAGFDRPLEVENVLRPEQPTPPVKTRYFGFIRLFFNGRRYF